MSKPTNKYTHIEGQRLEMDDDHAELFQKYTQKQLRYALARMIFPEATHISCARLAGYSHDSAGVRALEVERRPHVRLMLSRCEWKPRDIDPTAMKKVITRDDMDLWLSQMIRDPAIPFRQRLSAARQLTKLNGWDDPKNRKPDQHSILWYHESGRRHQHRLP